MSPITHDAQRTRTDDWLLGNRTKGRIVLERIRILASRWDRARGLFGRAPAQDEGFLFPGGDVVHTWFARTPFDVFFLDAELHVLALHRGVERGKVLRHASRNARPISALVTHAGHVPEEHVSPGDRFEWVPRTGLRIEQGAKPDCEDLLPGGMRLDLENRRLVAESDRTESDAEAWDGP